MAHTPRIYLPSPIHSGPLVIVGEAAKRLTGVMRVAAGDKLRVFNGDGREWAVAVDSAGRNAVRATVGEIVRQESPAALTLEVLCALIRPARLETAIEKCTEAGADLFRPIVTQHAARGDSASATRMERWERIAVEAAEQSGRLTVPVIEAPVPFTFRRGTITGALILCDATGRPWDEVRALLPEHGRVAVAVGPEGGWTGGELANARAAGAVLLRLGPNILRTETAAIVATALVRSVG